MVNRPDFLPLDDILLIFLSYYHTLIFELVTDNHGVPAMFEIILAQLPT